ncbi:MAG: hypothetical protein EPN20_15075 [Magnetospirillum sp.]|nr:MAG: hypothetical protein EPN20_15075 [Magnetospirillum sp.]
MGEQHWTPSIVEERLAEAASVLARLPEVKVRGHFCAWPPVIQEAWEAAACEIQLRRPPPSAAAIDRMDQALTWLAWLDATDTRIVWLRANGERWKVVCSAVGLSRATAHRHWMYALCVIACRLDGGCVPARRSRQYLVERTLDGAKK